MANDVLSGSSSHFQPDNLTRQVLSFQQNARILEEKIEQVLVKQRRGSLWLCICLGVET